MKYDFTIYSPRNDGSSIKWNDMMKKNPEVSPSVIPFSVADMELNHPPELMEGLKKFLDKAIFGYSLPDQEYFQAVCRWMKNRHHWDIQSSWITVVQGVVPAIYHGVRAFTNPGDGVIIMTPVYHPFYDIIRNSGRKIVENPLIVKDGRYTIDFEDLQEKAASKNTTLLVLCSPHNPVGRVWTKEELQSIAEICLKHNILVISDEIHFDLIMPGHKHTVFSTLSPEIAEKTVVCTAPSKTFNLAGLMTANIIISNKEMQTTFRKELVTTYSWGVNSMGLEACKIVYNQCEPWMNQLISLIHENSHLVVRFLSENLPQIKVYPLEGTYLQWLDFRELYSDHEELERKMIQDAQVFCNEGYQFGDAGKGFERINLACPTKELEKALIRIRDVFY